MLCVWIVELLYPHGCYIDQNYLSIFFKRLLVFLKQLGDGIVFFQPLFTALSMHQFILATSWFRLHPLDAWRSLLTSVFDHHIWSLFIVV